VQTFEIYHSYSPRAAVGLHAMRFEGEDDEYFAGIQHNWLLKRWNLPSAQANIYAGLGAGLAGELGSQFPPSMSISPGSLSCWRSVRAGRLPTRKSLIPSRNPALIR